MLFRKHFSMCQLGEEINSVQYDNERLSFYILFSRQDIYVQCAHESRLQITRCMHRMQQGWAADHGETSEPLL